MTQIKQPLDLAIIASPGPTVPAVLEDCGRFLRQWAGRLVRRPGPPYGQGGPANARPRLTLHSKIVLTTSAVLMASSRS